MAKLAKRVWWFLEDNRLVILTALLSLGILGYGIYRVWKWFH